MTEESSKKIQVVIDKTQAEKELAQKLEEANKTIGKLEEVNRALLSQDRKEFIPDIEPKKAVFGGETALLYEQPEVPKITTEGSYIDPCWIKSGSHEENIAIVQHLAKVAENKETYQKIQSRLLKKVISGNKPLNMEFQGSSKDFLKSPKTISEFASDEEKARLTAYNEKLRANRVNWRNLSEDQ